MTPLSSYGTNYTPPKVPVVPAKKYSGDLAFFEQLGDTLALNGAPEADAGLLGLLRNIGLSVDYGGTWLLPRLIGVQRAKDLAFRGDAIDSQQAADLGLVLEVIPDEEALETLRSLGYIE